MGSLNLGLFLGGDEEEINKEQYIEDTDSFEESYEDEEDTSEESSESDASEIYDLFNNMKDITGTNEFTEETFEFEDESEEEDEGDFYEDVTDTEEDEEIFEFEDESEDDEEVSYDTEEESYEEDEISYEEDEISYEEDDESYEEDDTFEFECDTVEENDDYICDEASEEFLEFSEVKAPCKNCSDDIKSNNGVQVGKGVSENNSIKSSDNLSAKIEYERLLAEERRKNELLREELKRKEKERIKQELIQKRIREAKDRKIEELRRAKGINDEPSYDGLKTPELYKEVLMFIKDNNIDYRKPIDEKILVGKFGSSNIKRLIVNSYMFKTQKGLILGKIK